MAKDKRLILLKQANKFFRQGKIDQAIKEYQQVLELKSDDLEVRRIIGDLQLKKNYLTDAISQFEWIAEYYMKDGFYTKAIAMYKRINRIDPNYEKALFRLADLYTKEGLVVEAKQIYLDVAEEYKRKGNQKAALNMYKKILEFDRDNVKMRLLLAENYLKEGMKDNAVNEYLMVTSVLINKRDFKAVEEVVQRLLPKLKDNRLIERLAFCFSAQGQEDKAIEMLERLGPDIESNIPLLKQLGEMYFNKNDMDKAEAIFKKITGINPDETEVIMKLGKVYLQREEYDRTFKLFEPIVDSYIDIKKYDEASSLLRFIIASNNTYFPALSKLAVIFKESGKNSNLIALYESLLPVYEQEGMREELERVLNELISLSDSPFVYEEKLARLKGETQKDEAEEEEEEQEKEFINLHLNVVEEALRSNNYEKAVDALKKAKDTYPRNIPLREKLFEILEEMKQIRACIDEGKELLNLYKFSGLQDEYKSLLEKLSALEPEDDQLVEMAVEEGTSIDIDFDKDELQEQFDEIDNRNIKEINLSDTGPVEENVLLLSEEENISDEEYQTEELSKSFSSIVKEIDFYLNDGYIENAEKLIQESQKKYPENILIKEKIEKLNKIKQEVEQDDFSDQPSMGDDMEFELTGSSLDSADENASGSAEVVVIPPKEETGEPLIISDEEVVEEEFELTGKFEQVSVESSIVKEEEPEEKNEMDFFPIDENQEMEFNVDSDAEAFPLEKSPQTFSSHRPDQTESEKISIQEESDFFEIESSITGEHKMVQDLEESKSVIQLEGIQGQLKDDSEDLIKIDDSEADVFGDLPLEVEMEERVERQGLPLFEVNRDEIYTSPSIIRKDTLVESDSAVSKNKEKTKSDSAWGKSWGSLKERSDEKVFDLSSSSNDDVINLDDIMIKEAEPLTPDVPFEGLEQEGFPIDGEEGIFKDEVLFLIDENCYEIEKNVKEELESVEFWVKELERQRSSTAEKSMIEIFEQFKKGVDEKIGHEDYDTRYNLGIAYKEMGLLEEAIHEFLISAKHSEKFFDSAGLLGMCFREKGMFDEAGTWFEKALETPGRKIDEYMAIKYEMVLNLRLREDFVQAKVLIEEILKSQPNYRDLAEIYQEVKDELNS